MGYFDDVDAGRAKQAERGQLEQATAGQEETARRRADYEAFRERDLPDIIRDYVGKASQVRPPTELLVHKRSYILKPTYKVQAYFLWHRANEDHRGVPCDYYVDKGSHIYGVTSPRSYPLTAQPYGGLSAVIVEMAGPEAGFDRATRTAEVLASLRESLET